MKKRIPNNNRGKSSKHFTRPFLSPEYQFQMYSPYALRRSNIMQIYHTSATCNKLPTNQGVPLFTVKKLRPYTRWKSGKKSSLGPLNKIPQPNFVSVKTPYTSQDNRHKDIYGIKYAHLPVPKPLWGRNRKRIIIKPLSGRYKHNYTTQNFIKNDSSTISVQGSIKNDLTNYISIMSSNKYKVIIKVIVVCNTQWK